MTQPKPIPDHVWSFPARRLRIAKDVVDGDTVDLEVDQGMHGRRVERFRLASVNAPEKKGLTLAAGLAAKAYVEQWLHQAGAFSYTDPDAWILTIRTYKADDFGRYLADIWRLVDGSHLNADLVSSGHAVPYMVIV